MSHILNIWDMWKCLKVLAQSCPTLCGPMDCIVCQPGSSVREISQTRILEWVTIPFSRGSSWPRDWTWVSCIAGGFFTIWATRDALIWDILIGKKNELLLKWGNYLLFKPVIYENTSLNSRRFIVYLKSKCHWASCIYLFIFFAIYFYLCGCTRS